MWNVVNLANLPALRIQYRSPSLLFFLPKSDYPHLPFKKKLCFQKNFIRFLARSQCSLLIKASSTDSITLYFFAFAFSPPHTNNINWISDGNWRCHCFYTTANTQAERETEDGKWWEWKKFLKCSRVWDISSVKSEPKKENKKFFRGKTRQDLCVDRKRWRDISDFILLLYLKSFINFLIPCMQIKQWSCVSKSNHKLANIFIPKFSPSCLPEL